MSPRPNRTDYAVALDRARRLSADGREQLTLGDAWTPEHLVLAGLLLCSVTSLAYHARRASLDVLASGSASGAVSQRADDGAWALRDVECRIEAELDPVPAGDELTALLVKAERGCFVGASLEPKPHYRWTVNGEEIA